jgi:hypothetical protein
VLIARDVVTLRLWEVPTATFPSIGALVGLVEVVVVCVAVYGVVRAIGWVIGGFMASQARVR